MLKGGSARWVEKVGAGRPYVQQAGEANLGCSKISAIIIPNIWLPNSPDWNSLDYHVRDMVERQNNKILYNSKDELKAMIMAAFTNLNKETVGKAYRRF